MRLCTCIGVCTTTPDKQEKATQTVPEQAEVFSELWTTA